MGKRNRSTLKRFFSSGSLPTTDHFEDLVDSTLNTVDEAFDKSPENGFEISSLGDYDSLISFFRDNNPKNAIWTISFDGKQDKLLIRKRGLAADPAPLVCLTPLGRVGIATSEPTQTLDVAGAIKSEGRIGAGTAGTNAVPADGKWHDITDDLTGCQALEVIAGAGRKDTGQYALMHAHALNTFNPSGLLFNLFGLKKRIRYQHAYYVSRGNKLTLRWVGNSPRYRLQLRSKCNYGNGVQVQYYITKLWFDHHMIESQPKLQDIE